VKSWKKKNKIGKFFSILTVFVQENINNTVLVLKSLILIHTYIKKGPSEILNERKVLELIKYIFYHWKDILTQQQTNPGRDKKRSLYTVNLIIGYCEKL
jgi:hypothetical protein